MSLKHKIHVKTSIALVIAFIVLFVWGRSAESAELGIGVGTGHGHTNDTVTQGLTIISDDLRWYAQVTRFGSEGYLDTNVRWSGGYRLFCRRDEDFKPFMRFGVALFDHDPMPLISDNVTYDLGVGLRWRDVIEFEYNHNSTAGRSERNTGVDLWVLRLVMQF